MNNSLHIVYIQNISKYPPKSFLNPLYSIGHFAFGIRATELIRFPCPILLGGFNPLKKRKDRHHTLKGPETDIFLIGDRDLSSIDKEMISHKHREIAISINPFHRYLQSVHGLISLKELHR
jgi:hypothetical protein